jgi:hypothetical protein
MSNMADRLALCEAILGLIEKKRAETGDPYLAQSVERAIVENEFHDVEHEILENPGAIEPWLVRRRRSTN